MSRAVSGRSARSGATVMGRQWVRILQDYFWESSLPLTGLLFLLPMIVLYEVGTHVYASDYQRHTEVRVLAFSYLRHFLELFGATGRYLPAMAVVGILLAWHIARRDTWQLRYGAAFGMTLESSLLAFPVLALSTIMGLWMPLAAATKAGQLPGGIVLALGAGIYEELIFRLMAFTLLNVILIDLLRVNRKTALVIIVLGTSILFSAYHYWSPYSAPFRWGDFLFRTLSGVYFGTLFIWRGFGVTAGSHAAYDIYYFSLRALSAGV
jgi:hypothetical protein